ncbi:MAG: glycosyltransferase family 1 protein [Synechococcaceae cyanobacterium]|nr:glycosyltransferase family 1 protein [Synechococcaceae cyanobacterium]
MSGLKIAFDVSQTGWRKAGCGFYAAALIDGLLESASGEEFTLLTSFGDFFHDPLQALAYPHIRHGVKYGPRMIQRKSACQFWTNPARAGSFCNRFDIVHANNFWCPPWPVRGSLIYTLYDMSFIEHPEWTTESIRKGCLECVQRAVRFADRFVAISEATKQAFLRQFPAISSDRVHVIYPASRFGQPGFHPEAKKPSNRIFNDVEQFFLSTGTIEPRKNQSFLLDLYQQFRSRGGQSIPLVLAGKKGWLMEGFDQQIAASPWADDIHVLGYVSDGELAWLYQHCLVNLYPSHYEGFGLPVLEGMCFGTPVMCSSSTSMPEIVGEAGILLPPDDLNGWVHALESLTSEPQRREQLRRSAVARAARFDWKRSVAQILRLYRADSS